MHRLFNRNALLLADQAIFSGSSFLVTLLLARVLTMHEFGTFAALILVLYLVVSLVSAFVVQPLQVSLPAVRRTADYLAFSLWAQAGIALALLALLSLVRIALEVGMPYGSEAAATRIAHYTSLHAPVMLFSVGFLMHDYFRKRLLAENEIEQTFISDVLLLAAHGGAMLLLAWNTEVTLPKAIHLLGIGYILPVLYMTLRSISAHYPNMRWISYVRSHIAQGKWLFYTAVIQWWSGNFFVIASGFLLGSAALGALRLVQTVFGVLNILFQTFENYVLPQTAGKLQLSTETGIQFLKKSSREPMIFVAVLLLALFVFSDTVIVLAGGEIYREYGFLVKGMSVLYVFIFVGYPIRIAIRALLMNKVFFEGYLLTFAFAVSSFWLLLTRFELAGALAGLILSQIILLVYWQLKLVKKQILLWK